MYSVKTGDDDQDETDWREEGEREERGKGGRYLFSIATNPQKSTINQIRDLNYCS